MILPSRLFVSDLPAEMPVFHRREGLVALGEFRQDTARMVAAIRQSGAGAIVLHADDNYEFAVGLMACLYAGKRTIIPGNLCCNTRERLEGPHVVFSCDLRPAEVGAELAPPDSAAVEVEFYTSGSTGEPKRIIRNFANLEAELQMLGSVFPDDGRITEVFPTVSFHHAYGIIFGLLLPLSRGMVSDTAPFQGLEPWLARVARLSTPGSLAWLVTTPAFLRVWAENTELNQLNLEAVRLLSAGAPLPMVVARRVASASHAEVYEIFGSSETGVVACRRPLETQEWQSFASVRIELLDGAGMQVYSPAVSGCNGVCLGDSAELLPGGRFRLLPRVDRIVKLADKRLSLSEVEQCLLESGLVTQACALVLHEQRVPRLAVAVVPGEAGMKLLQEQGYAACKKALREQLAKQIERTLLPRKWRIVGELPANAQGKVTQAAVAALFNSPLQLPVMTPVFKSADQLTFNMLYVKDSSYLAGHFPGYPIVPGVVILQAVTVLIRNYWGLNVDGITRLKFSAETLPGYQQLVSLKRRDDSVSVDILLQPSGQRAGQGRLIVSPTENGPSYLI